MSKSTTPDDLVETVRNRSSYKGAIIRAAIVKTSSGPKVCAIIAIASNKEEKPRNNHDYGPLELREGWFETDQFLSWVSSFAIESKVGMPGGLQVDVKGNWSPNTSRMERYLPSNYEHLEVNWPSDLYRFVLNQDVVAQPPSDILAPVHLPFFPRGSEAVEYWLGVRDISQRDIIGKISVLLPNFTARIREAEVGSRRLAFRVERGTGTPDLLARLFAKDYHTGERFQKDEIVRSEKVDFRIDIDWTSLNLILVEKDSGDILDYMDLHSSWPELPKGVLWEAGPEDLEEMIRRGEREDVEFKISLTNSEDIVKTVVAFANGSGGILIIGVNDEGEVVGVSELPDVIEDKIRKWVRNWCEIPVELDFQSKNLREHDISLVIVKQAKVRPVWMKDKGPYIRYGSTNRVASRSEVEQMFREEGLGIASFR